MRYEFDELKSVFYNYEVGYLEGLKAAARYITLGGADALLLAIESQEAEIEEENEEEE